MFFEELPEVLAIRGMHCFVALLAVYSLEIQSSSWVGECWNIALAGRCGEDSLSWGKLAPVYVTLGEVLATVCVLYLAVFISWLKAEGSREFILYS